MIWARREPGNGAYSRCLCCRGGRGCVHLLLIVVAVRGCVAI